VAQAQPQQQQQPQPQQQPQQPLAQPQQHMHAVGALQQQQQAPVQQVVTSAVLDRQVPIQITLPPQAGIPDAPQRILSIQVPASALQSKKFIISH